MIALQSDKAVKFKIIMPVYVYRHYVREIIIFENNILLTVDTVICDFDEASVLVFGT